MRRRGNNNCSGACTLGSRKAARIRASRAPRKRRERKRKEKKGYERSVRGTEYIYMYVCVCANVRECARLWK